MRPVATSGIENGQNSSILGMPWKMHGASLSQVITIITNTSILSVVLALYHFYVQARNKFGSLRETLSIRKNIHTSAVPAEGTMFSETREHHSETMYAHSCVLFHLHILIVVK